MGAGLHAIKIAHAETSVMLGKAKGSRSAFSRAALSQVGKRRAEDRAAEKELETAPPPRRSEDEERRVTWVPGRNLSMGHRNSSETFESAALLRHLA
jgi:hypothetical protein